MGHTRNAGEVVKVVMVPLIISQDGAIHRDTVRRWKIIAHDIPVDWVRMAQSVLRYNVVIVGNYKTKDAGSPRHGEKTTLKSSRKNIMTLQKELKRSQSEEKCWALNVFL